VCVCVCAHAGEIGKGGGGGGGVLVPSLVKKCYKSVSNCPRHDSRVWSIVKGTPQLEV
jgi:hypothetical protein